MCGIALVVVGFGSGIGWTRLGSDIDPATEPRGLQAFGAGVVLAFAVLLLVGCAVGAIKLIKGTYPRDAIPRWNGVTHDVAVYDTRPDPGDRRNQFDPYFIALCECGWLGEPRDSSEEALHDAQSHNPLADTMIRRPVG